VHEAVGPVEYISAILRMPSPPDTDPRWSAALGGGATMDLRCYGFSCLRLLGRYAGDEPTVVAGQADERPGRPGVDERLFVDVAYPSGATGRAGSDMDATARDLALLLRGARGEIEVPMFPVLTTADWAVGNMPWGDAAYAAVGIERRHLGSALGTTNHD
jgi:predicted dehydrogenase